LDINPSQNPYCREQSGKPDRGSNSQCPNSPTSAEQNVVKTIPDCWTNAFQKYGFLWGGDPRWGPLENSNYGVWGRDNMHFQFYGDPSTI